MYNPSSLEARRTLRSSEVDPKPIWLMNVQLSLSFSLIVRVNDSFLEVTLFGNLQENKQSFHAPP